MKKRIMKVACIIACFAMMMPATNAFAYSYPDDTPVEVVSPYLVLILDSGCSLSVSGRTASVRANVSCLDSVTSCSVRVELQRKNGSRWETVDSDSGSIRSNTATWNFTFSVTPGETYRARATFTAYSSTSDESETVYSD